MHIKLARLLILVVLALTIPIQGLAAATAGLCMSLGHHDAGMAATHDHGADHDGVQPEGDDSADGVHCAPCVACCGAASIAPGTTTLLPDRMRAEAIAAAAPAFVDVLPHLLDRPPLPL